MDLINNIYWLKIKKAIKRLWKIQSYSGYCFAFHRASDFPWHALGCQYSWYLRGKISRHIFKLIMTLSWPLRLLHHSIKCWQRVAKQISNKSKLSRKQLFFRQFFFSLLSGIPPIVYYRFGFYHEENQAEIPFYLFDHEIMGFFSKLNGFKQDSAIYNKYDFFIRCQQADLPVVPVLSHYKDGQHLTGALTSGVDLFSKPADACQGRGGELWQAISEDSYKNSHGQCLSAQQLEQFFLTLSKREAIIVQPCVNNHSTLQQLYGKSILTGRLITAKVNEGHEYLTGIVKLPRRHQIANNIGLSCAIDSENGCLGSARMYRPGTNLLTHHPDTGALIAGQRLPDWQQAKNLVCQAHKLFPDFIFLGWDVVFSDQGVLLLEVNQFWETGMVQLVHQTPFGKTRFADIARNALAPTR